MKVLTSKKKFEIRLNNDSNSIELEYKDIIAVKDFRKILGKVYDYSVEHHTTKNLVDMRKMGMIPPEAQKWIETEWFPKMIQAGVLTYGMVVAQSAAAQASTDDLTDKIDDQREAGGVKNGFFGTLEEARNWIANQ